MGLAHCPGHSGPENDTIRPPPGGLPATAQCPSPSLSAHFPGVGAPLCHAMREEWYLPNPFKTPNVVTPPPPPRGGVLAQGLGIRLIAVGGAYWPLATAQSDPLWPRTCFGCVNGAPG